MNEKGTRRSACLAIRPFGRAYLPQPLQSPHEVQQSVQAFADELAASRASSANAAVAAMASTAAASRPTVCFFMVVVN
jgi:hypothetical protein